MAKYRVWAQSISDVYIDVEADSPEEAIEIADNADGSEFTEDPSGGDWKLWGDPEAVDLLEED